MLNRLFVSSKVNCKSSDLCLHSLVQDLSLCICIVLYLLCIRQIHTRLDIELVKYYIVTVTE